MSAADKRPRTHRAPGRYVLADERVALATRHHWARLLEPILTAAALFVAVALLVELATPAFGDRADSLWWLWLIALGRLALRFVEWRVEWFVATDKRMFVVTGIVAHKVAMMPLRKVTDLSYSRSVPGRLLGYGEFVLESAGQDQTMRRIPWVPHPDANYQALCATLFAPGTPAAALRRSRFGVVEVPRHGHGRAPVLDGEDTQPIPLAPPRLDDADAPSAPGTAWDVSEPTGTFAPVDRSVPGQSEGDHGRRLPRT